MDNLNQIQSLLEDPAIAEIMIDGWQHIYVEKEGQLVDMPSPFHSENDLYSMAQAIATQSGCRLDATQPIASCRLMDGIRVEIVIPPVSLVGPAITILKPVQTELTLEDLIRFGSLNQPAADFLRACVESRVNIVVSGGIASGKTTLLNIISRWIPDDERILVLKSQDHFKLPHKRIVSLETTPPKQGQGQVTLRDLLQSAVRMRPDRIIVTEVRGEEVIDLLYIFNAGHDGCMFSIHSFNPRDTLTRLESLASLGGSEFPLLALREQIASAIDLIVHVEKMRDGSRKIVYITEVIGMEEGAIVLQDIFHYIQTGFDQGKVEGILMPTGLIPRFLSTLQNAGFNLPVSMFTPLDKQLSDMVWCIVTGLRAGYNLLQVLEVLSQEAPEPAASTSKWLQGDLHQGLSLEVALAKWKAAFPSVYIARLADTILESKRLFGDHTVLEEFKGGPLAEMLDPLEKELLREAGEDPAFHKIIRQMAQQLGAELPDRLKFDP